MSNITPKISNALCVEDILRCRGKVVALDTETTGLHWWADGLIGIGIHCPAADVSGYYICSQTQDVPIGPPKVKSRKVWKGLMDYTHSKRGRRVFELETTTEQPTQRQHVEVPDLAEAGRAAVREIASDSSTTIIGHNLKFDAHFLRLPLWEVPCLIMDTSIMVHLQDSRDRKALAVAEQKFLGRSTKRVHVERAKGETDTKPWAWEAETLALYCENDCIVTFQLAQTLMPLMRELDLVRLFRWQMKFLRVIQAIENYGFMTDHEFIDQAVEAFSRNLLLMEQELQDAIGYEFNWKSNPQLSKAIYEDLGIEKPVNPFADADGVDRTRFAFKGQYNKHMTSTFILREKADHPLAALISDLREAEKLRRTVSSYRELSDSRRIVHSNFKITGTRTGRLSSGEPNLQNVPSEHRTRETQSVYSGGAIRSEEYNLRQAFRARPGRILLSIDHKQQEMRMFGILSEDPNMLKILASGQDVHLGVALMVWGDCGEERNAIHREWAKTIGFGLVYGMTTGSLQHRLNKTAEEANAIADQYWSTFPRIRPWLQEVIDQVDYQGYVRYWSGRIWREEEYLSFYKGANAQIQGGAADFMSLMAIRAHQLLRLTEWGNIVSIVHDEILFEVKEEDLETAMPYLLCLMEGPDVFGLPFAADCKTGYTYGSMHKVPNPEGYRSADWQQLISTLSAQHPDRYNPALTVVL